MKIVEKLYTNREPTNCEESCFETFKAGYQAAVDQLKIGEKQQNKEYLETKFSYRDFIYFLERDV